MNVRLTINGAIRRADLDVSLTLVEALRDHLGLPSTKQACGTGSCGACTVLIDGRSVNACLTLAVMHEGAEITTIEGLRGHALQEAFVRHDGLQCGYCTPGQIVAAAALLDEGHAGSDEAIRQGMSGNLCRCGAYPNIVAAIREVAGR